MRASKTRTLLLTAAGVTVATAGCLGAGTAQAVVPGSPMLARAAFSQRFAGYRVGYATHWRFRWLTATVPVLSCAATAARHGWLLNGTALGVGDPRWQAELGVRCAGAAAAPVEALVTTNGRTAAYRLPLRMRAGDHVTLSLYYDRPAGKLRLRATDRSTGRQASRWLTVGMGISYQGAGAGSVFAGPRSSPPANTETAAYSDVHLTSYSGHRATMFGPWPATEVVATTTGDSRGAVVARPSMLLSGGTRFLVWQRGSS